MHAYFSDDTEVHRPAGRAFVAARFRMLRERVVGELPGVQVHPSVPVSAQQLAWVHDEAYVAAVFEGRLSAAQQREIGFAWSPEMVLRSRRSVGATLAAAFDALREGVAANLAGGSHHARREAGSGYCVFNDVAVAARGVQRAAGVVGAGAEERCRVAVIDLDVHQGNGTAAIFAGDDSVFTLSMHGARNFPFRKVAGDLDVELPDECGDDEYLRALDGALDTLWRRMAGAGPQLIFFLAGADPHEGDRLGRLKLTSDGLRERDRRVFAAARERGIPLVLTMAGGYGADLARMVDLQLETVRQAWQSWTQWQGTPGRLPTFPLNNPTP